jgi:hypoxanthine phosphoribosyltransferase
LLLDTAATSAIPSRIDHVGFEIPDVWVIGYGLDAAGAGRALPYVAALESEG